MRIDAYQSKYQKQVELFFSKCNVKNNSSWETLGTHKRDKSKLFLVFDEDMVVGMCYAHDFNKYYPNSWRIFARTATLPDYRGWKSPVKKGMASAAGCLAHTCIMQVDWAKSHGAKEILFTTNVEGGMSSSQTLGNFLHKVVKHDDSFEWYDRKEIYQCDQDVWRLLKKDIIT